MDGWRRDIRCSPASRGSWREATEGASRAGPALAPSGPLGHLPRIAGEDLSDHATSAFASCR
ncbi:hypothetical protein CSW63_18400 [Caulobacter sp. FWC26]|nr:hypothetical protein CSW63_18400 [Caulobacter sp. FWC26]